MTVTITDDLIQRIGLALGRAADETDPAWDYAGYVFTTPDGVNSEREKFLFAGGQRGLLNDRAMRREINDSFLRLREVTRDNQDIGWVAMKYVMRRADRSVKFLFEFDDIARWAVTPANAGEMERILLGDVFPEALP